MLLCSRTPHPPQTQRLRSPCLAAARSRSGSDVPPARHSTPSRRFATRWGRQENVTTLRHVFVGRGLAPAAQKRCYIVPEHLIRQVPEILRSPLVCHSRANPQSSASSLRGTPHREAKNLTSGSLEDDNGHLPPSPEGKANNVSRLLVGEGLAPPILKRCYFAFTPSQTASPPCSKQMSKASARGSQDNVANSPHNKNSPDRGNFSNYLHFNMLDPCFEKRLAASCKPKLFVKADGVKL